MNDTYLDPNNENAHKTRVSRIPLLAGVGAVVIFMLIVVLLAIKPASAPAPANPSNSASTQRQADQGSVPCSGESAYTINGNTVSYRSEKGFCKLVEGADAASFTALEFGFAKDARHGFNNGQLIEFFDSTQNTTTTADGATLKALSKQYARDKDHVYFFDYDYPTSPVAIVRNADVATFTPYGFSDITSGAPFAKDARQVFIGSNLFYGADPNTFQYAGTGGEELRCSPYYKDATHIFMNSEIVERADPATFRYIGEADIPPNYFHSPCLAVDKSNVYLDAKRIPNADPNTIEILGSYLKDKRAVYFNTDELKGSDPKTFTTTDATSAIGKDASTIYECGQAVLPNTADARYLGEYYGKTQNTIYYKGRILADADTKSFTVVGGSGTFSCESSVGGYAKDVQHVYYNGKNIDGADAASFQLSTEIGIGFDRNNEYVNGVKVPTDFVSCSTEISDLPGGFKVWQSKLPKLVNSTSTTDFQFCTLANKEKFIGYKPDTDSTTKHIYWFDAKDALIKSTGFDCGYSIEPQRFRALNGSTLTISCLVSDACTAREFYTLDLNVWKSSNSSTFVKTEEHHDCGYRG